MKHISSENWNEEKNWYTNNGSYNNYKELELSMSEEVCL